MIALGSQHVGFMPQPPNHAAAFPSLRWGVSLLWPGHYCLRVGGHLNLSLIPSMAYLCPGPGLFPAPLDYSPLSPQHRRGGGGETGFSKHHPAQPFPTQLALYFRCRGWLLHRQAAAVTHGQAGYHLPAGMEKSSGNQSELGWA